MSRNRYENPLVDRYASPAMSAVWSPQNKFSTWRRLWLALAEAEQELGVPISDAQLDEMRAHLDDIDFDEAARHEKDLRHDVMAHVHTFGTVCPTAMPIIHLGATSCYVGDNTDLIQIRQALEIVRDKLVLVIRDLRNFAEEHADLPTLGFTHYQAAQLTTVGKRATLWLQDFMLDLEEVERLIEWLPFRGVKGTTGTQASFLELFDGDHDKVRKLDARVAELMGFGARIPVSGQTYTRKIDSRVLGVMSQIASSTHKFATDVRLLMNLKEIDEPFGKAQIGSSAMPYKRNPMRSERICSLARFVMSLESNAHQTHANQWFERTLDDSANRRLSLPEAFLGVDVVLNLSHNVAGGLTVWPNVIHARIMQELPYMASEVILMACVTAGGDRQHLHEKIRLHAVAAATRVKSEGAANDMLERVAADPDFAAVHGKLETLLDPIRFCGRAPQQTREYLAEYVDPVLASAGSVSDTSADLLV